MGILLMNNTSVNLKNERAQECIADKRNRMMDEEFSHKLHVPMFLQVRQHLCSKTINVAV